jgi:hypothetical protein
MYTQLIILPFALLINLDFQHDKEIHVYFFYEADKSKDSLYADLF